MYLRRPRKRRFGNELARHRARRLAAFAQRCNYEFDDGLPPPKVFTSASGVWRYSPVHVFADELALLARFCLTPADCLVVDAYCSTARDAYFVEVVTARRAERASELSASWWPDDPPWLHLRAIVDATEVTCEVFERALANFETVGLLDVPIGHSRRVRPSSFRA